MTLVTTSLCSVEVASRTLVRLAERRAEAALASEEWKSWEALETQSRLAVCQLDDEPVVVESE
ncbi:hypothetical protein ACIGKR_07040 [Rhodococcus qingshengii]|uniref:hypothetical protein n=1 Tax=Rhodococcus qingshengii TaxID=334542 RepID=UPI0037C52B40